MKKITLFIIALIACLSVNAQEEGKIRVSLDLGYAIPSDGGGGVAIYLEPKYNIKDNMSVGVRLGSAALIKNVVSTSGGEVEGEIGANGTYLGTFDYHFNGAGTSFVPYVGAGIGFASVANIDIDTTNGNSGTVNSNELEASGKFGGMIRAGFEWGKFRLGVDYNIIPESDLENFDGDIVGTAKNSYVGITLGFFVGGGKWGR